MFSVDKDFISQMLFSDGMVWRLFLWGSIPNEGEIFEFILLVVLNRLENQYDSSGDPSESHWHLCAVN